MAVRHLTWLKIRARGQGRVARACALAAVTVAACAWDASAAPTVNFKPPPWPDPPVAPVAASPGDATLAPEDRPAALPAADWLDAQVELARRGFSSGSIDGVAGPQTRAALVAYQTQAGLEPTGALDEPTRFHLALVRPAWEEVELTEADFAGLQPVSPTWLEKSQQPAMAHETVLERLAERAHAHPGLVRKLNPGFDWTQATPGARVRLPAVGPVQLATPLAHLHIRLADRVLQGRDADGRLVVHFPVSIARDVAKRPVGELHITVVVPNPDYTFNPEVFPESEEGRRLGRKLMIPPGPNNPVGLAWIGLDRPGYGIHGTPLPEQVGRTESHGCFRLANWDALTLLPHVWVGMPVQIEP